MKKFLLLCLISLFMHSFSYATFIASRDQFHKCSYRQCILVASTGRSGSTMLTSRLMKFISPKFVFKTHLLPPDADFKGKIIFIFSNPDFAAESALYMIFHNNSFPKTHFNHVETADRNWVTQLGGTTHQTEKDNLLSYDALGNYEHLKVWLGERTESCKLVNAQIFAVKYEHLWDPSTLQALRRFLNISYFSLPPKRERGKDEAKLLPLEKRMRELYNLGTKNNPRYAAYDDARLLWKEAPPFQFLRIIP